MVVLTPCGREAPVSFGGRSPFHVDAWQMSAWNESSPDSRYRHPDRLVASALNNGLMEMGAWPGRRPGASRARGRVRPNRGSSAACRLRSRLRAGGQSRHRSYPDRGGGRLRPLGGLERRDYPKVGPCRAGQFQRLSHPHDGGDAGRGVASHRQSGESGGRG